MQKKLLLFIAVPVLLGGLSGLISGDIGMQYEALVKPPFSPPGIVFPIVWIILYILMGMSAWLACKAAVAAGVSKERVLVPYGVQLFLNIAWPILFFRFQLYPAGALWALFLTVAVVWMILRFHYVCKLAAYLQIPYLLWCLFAVYLSFGVALLNA